MVAIRRAGFDADMVLTFWKKDSIARAAADDHLANRISSVDLERPTCRFATEMGFPSDVRFPSDSVH